ncbi:hypothetical protein BaRGS_00039802, partial [Batillaria attramentaria]
VRMPERDSSEGDTDSIKARFSLGRVRYKVYPEPEFRAPSVVFWGSSLTRPTTSFARGCKLWSRERQYYEDERRSNMADFASRPYLEQQYPELEKHYPGTWRVAGPSELERIVARLRAQTWSTYYRQRYPDVRSAPVSRQRGRSRASGQSLASSGVTSSGSSGQEKSGNVQASPAPPVPEKNPILPPL